MLRMTNSQKNLNNIKSKIVILVKQKLMFMLHKENNALQNRSETDTTLTWEIGRENNNSIPYN